MPRHYIHPRLLAKGFRVVLRNGASLDMRSTVKRQDLHLTQDITNHSAWTGIKSQFSENSGQLLKFKSRFNIPGLPGADAAAAEGAAAGGKGGAAAATAKP